MNRTGMELCLLCGLLGRGRDKTSDKSDTRSSPNRSGGSDGYRKIGGRAGEWLHRLIFSLHGF